MTGAGCVGALAGCVATGEGCGATGEGGVVQSRAVVETHKGPIGDGGQAL